MIEARFDDLTGTSPSFRLVEPVGVLEARRLDEVVPTLAAAENAASRGLWVGGFVAYEAAPALDAALAVRAPAPDAPFAALPLAWFAMFEGRAETALPAPRDAAPSASPDAWRPSITRARYDESLSRIHGHIAAGDTYQVNFTFRLHASIAGDDRGLYRDLCFAQRGAHAGYLRTGRYRILSASPELFFRIDGTRLTTRPMKGTAPRGRFLEEDEAVRARLSGSVKDRAENAMIVDLLRNDLGRISRTGSVRWTKVFEPERYETVWQLTSTVSSELEPGRGLVDVFRALFPCGSVTGAPKVRTMEIIAALEDGPRGAYCGAVGYLAPAGASGPSAVFNVPIRTVVLDEETHLAEYGVGGGITFDSRSASEYEETIAKSRVLTSRRPSFELLETMSRDPRGPIRRLEEHVARLRDSARYFGFAFDEHAVRLALEGVASRAERPMRIRLRLARAGTLHVTATPMDAGTADPVRVAVDHVPVDPADVFLFHKTTLRERYDDARNRHPDADDVLLVNTRGEITEASSSNVAAQIDGRWCTPPLDSGLLPGTERATLLADGTLQEQPLTPADIARADGLALFNSVRGWRDAEIVVV